MKKSLLMKYLSENMNILEKRMKKPYSFNQEQMNGIVEETYDNIIKECEKLKQETACPNEQVVALLSVIASNFTSIIDSK